MMILGITAEGHKLLLDQQGKRVQADQKPDRIILGLAIDQIISKRIWLDADLTDEQRVIFLKQHFDDHTDMIIDYDCIKQDQSRELLHVYGVSGRTLHHCLQHHQLKAKQLVVETSLHGLGRALVKRYELTTASFHCISLFDEYVLLSGHAQDVLLYYHQEPIHGTHDALCAVRRALLRYQCDEDYREIDQLIYVYFSKHSVFDDIQLPNLALAPMYVPYDDSQTIIPYGLALRGLL